MTDEMTIRYVGGHAEVYNSESGNWKNGETKTLPRETAELFLRSGSLFQLTIGPAPVEDDE